MKRSQSVCQVRAAEEQNLKKGKERRKEGEKNCIWMTDMQSGQSGGVAAWCRRERFLREESLIEWESGAAGSADNMLSGSS